MEDNLARHEKLRLIIEKLGDMIDAADNIEVNIERGKVAEPELSIESWLNEADDYIASCDERTAILNYNRAVRRIEPNSTIMGAMKSRALAMELIRPLLQKDKYSVAEHIAAEHLPDNGVEVAGTKFSYSDELIRYDGKPIFLDGQNFTLAHLFISTYRTNKDKTITNYDIEAALNEASGKDTTYGSSDIRSLITKLRKPIKTATGEDRDYFLSVGKNKRRFNP